MENKKIEISVTVNDYLVKMFIPSEEENQQEVKEIISKLSEILEKQQGGFWEYLIQLVDADNDVEVKIMDSTGNFDFTEGVMKHIRANLE